MLDAESLAGSVLSGRYEVLAKIGAGGMAIVYKAHDKVLDRDVAIKILRENFEEKQEIVSNFIKEARSSASLVHPNVVSVYDVCEQDGLNYMVMELVDGITLKEYIKKHPRLPWQEACDYAIQIGQGIQAAHERGIIHRDIKPQNIIMAPGGVLKVTDFGIAKAMETDKTIAGGTALGSVHYISPEQARGGYTDFRSDIYSLGIVLYEMLAGRVPFDGDSPVSVALMHIEEEPVNVKCVNMDVPADLAYVTMKAMSRDQSKRYQNMQDFIEDLRAVLADEPLPSKDGSEEKKEDDDFLLPEIKRSVPQYNDDDEVQPRKRQASGGNTKKKRSGGKKKGGKKKSAHADRNSVVLALSTIGVILVIAAVVLFMTINPMANTVPQLTNMSIEDAIATAEQSGYSVSDEIEYSLSDTVQENYVISQLPEAGVEAPKSEPIKLIVSLGTSGGGIAVPDVTGKAVDEAGELIENETLTYRVVSEYSDTVDAGYVIRQTPLAGTHINSGDIVTLHVSVGRNTQTEERRTVQVPSVIGMYRDNAESTLGMQGLGIGTVTYMPSDAEEGTVVMQSPAEGAWVEEASGVTIVLSSGSTDTTLGSEYRDTVPQESSGSESTNEETEDNTDSSSESGTGETETGGSSSSDNSGSESGSESEAETGSSGSDSSGSGSTEMFSVRIPDAANDTVNVEIVSNGQVVHNAMHSKTEGTVTVEIADDGSGSASVQAYIDGAKVSDKTITF
ncbi:MAG TPA: Stk1 family PASTA domain-containing Ser/Thr kinase [Candidatus Ornithomonoglobus merdipullorum]|uniref:non-specific serine/threonine protein kinase n=1 Tax=Candidatus Ornithomonoglobus merdipullorum TaxID=2840895 RepID=A0A9D1SE88_9FIRM|nr:Stk1 family PASTA domain-containing Ser/Thr kinase [Candidatus Ornithomonoglobus merdipullorum]